MSAWAARDTRVRVCARLSCAASGVKGVLLVASCVYKAVKRESPLCPSPDQFATASGAGPAVGAHPVRPRFCNAV
eukprot:scaffold35481_cov63-Phaeocystis_antarctica.AAC.2